jgi:hypothetical protein
MHTLVVCTFLRLDIAFKYFVQGEKEKERNMVFIRCYESDGYETKDRDFTIDADNSSRE